MKKTVQATEPYVNPYDALSRTERSDAYYGAVKSNKKDQRDFIESMARLLPVNKGSTPMTRDQMAKLFRGKSGKQKQEEREIKRAMKRAAEIAERKNK